MALPKSIRVKSAALALVVASAVGTASCTGIRGWDPDGEVITANSEERELPEQKAKATAPAKPTTPAKAATAARTPAPKPLAVAPRPPAPTSAPAAVAAASRPAPKAAAVKTNAPEAALASRTPNRQVMMFVQVDRLNVRGGPTTTAPVVGQLVRGSSFLVSIDSGWARIGDGKFVQVKFLSTESSPTPERRAAFSKSRTAKVDRVISSK